MSTPGSGREAPSVGGPHESEPGQAGERHVTTQTEVRSVHLTVQRNLRLLAAHNWLREKRNIIIFNINGSTVL